ncbi:MAG: hypothetical protein O3A21_00485 [Proteobacteria bacterium]|nr:hypothetical protein [Pseudomonadota bacterium]
MGGLIIRRAQFSDVEAGVYLGREIHGNDAAVDWLPLDEEKIHRLAQGWLTSRSFIVLVAEDFDLARYETWPASVQEARTRRYESTIGFFVGYRHRNASDGAWLADDVAMFVRQSKRGYLAAARLLLRFIDWARACECSEVCLGASSGYVIRAAGLDYQWLGLEQLGPYYRARLR